jgi:pimeloyl-ACP methyl ester carboxylesterase
MSYQQFRKAMLEARAREVVRTLLGRMNPNKPTVILLPGGMGSELARSRRAYSDNAPPSSFGDVVWMDLGIFLMSDGAKLMIDANGRDLDDYVVGAVGPFHFSNIFTDQTPYVEFESFCATQGWNYAVFAYDWRRPLQESAALLRYFVKTLKEQGTVLFPNAFKLENVHLVCHSMGGPVMTLALRDNAFAGEAIGSFTTVGSPLYGTATHQQRYYKGQDPLNAAYGVEFVTELIGSLPGPYSLMMLPKAVYDLYGAQLGLGGYPVMDFDTGNPADPFDPAQNRRWPNYVRRNASYIAEHRNAMIEIAKPLATSVKPRYFNVRAMTKSQTPVKLAWKNIDGNSYSPGGDPMPLHEVMGKGDGTVPFWSAIHADTKPENKIDLRQAWDHGLLFEHREVHNVVASIVERGRITPARVTQIRRMAAPVQKPVASRQEMMAAARKAVTAAEARRSPPPEIFKPDVQRAIFKELLANRAPVSMKAPARFEDDTTPPAPAGGGEAGQPRAADPRRRTRKVKAKRRKAKSKRTR